MKKILIACLLNLLWVVSSRATITFIPDTGNTTTNGVNLHAAIFNAGCGDTITVQVGITYFAGHLNGNGIPYIAGCNLQLTVCTGNAGGCVTTNLPAYGSRIIPSLHAQYMAKITTDSLPAFFNINGAGHATLLGLDISDSSAGSNAGGANGVGVLVQFTNFPTAANYHTAGSYIVDRCFIHPSDITPTILKVVPITDMHSFQGIFIGGDVGPSIIIGNDIRGFGGYEPGTQPWTASHVAVVGEIISDGTHAQTVTVGGTTGGSAPAWNATLNGFTTDNTVTWKNTGSAVPVRLQAYGILVVQGGPVTIENNYIEAAFNNIFITGSGYDPDHTSVMSSPTNTSVTLTTTAGMYIGDMIALQYSGPSPNNCPEAMPTLCFQTVMVDTINGNNITYHGFGGNGQLGPGVIPDNGGLARWDGFLPHDIVTTHNTMWKLFEWQSPPFAVGSNGSAKGYMEIKQCVDCRVEGNVTGGGCASYNMEVQGTTTNNQTPWMTLKNFILRSNLMQANGFAWTLQGLDLFNTSTAAANVLVTNNLVQQMGNACPTENPGGNEEALSATYGSDITYTHNTIRVSTAGPPYQFASLVLGNGLPTPFPGGQRSGALNFTFKDNIANYGYYGIHGSVAGEGNDCLANKDMWQPNGPIIGASNIIINNYPGGAHESPTTSYCGGGTSSQFPLSTIVTTDAAVGFVNIAASDAGGDYHGAALASSSPYKGTASDGGDPGVNFAALDAALGPLATGNVPGTRKGWLAGQ